MVDTETRTDLASLGTSGKPPKTRMQSARAVREMHGRTDESYRKRFHRNALVKGLVDGNRPFNQSQLADSGQKYRANFNNGIGESYLGTAVTAFYDLFSEVDRYATCQVQEEGLPEANKWTDEISAHFDWLLRKNDRLDYNVQLTIHDMVLYGSGPQVWEDTLDWRSKAVGHNNLRLPDGAPANVCDWEYCFIDCNYRVDQLYSMIADSDKAKKLGYNVAEIRKAIMKATPEDQQRENGKDWLRYQQWIRNNECSAGNSSKVSRCTRFYYKEFDKEGDGYGKVSEMLVWLDGDGEAPLYHAIDSYADWREAIDPFFWDRGDGTAHSVRGLGVKMFHLLHALNRLQCAQYDAATASIAIKFKALGNTASQQLSVANLGPFQTFHGPFEPITNQGVSNLEPSLAVANDINQTLNSNLGQYRQSTDKQTGNPRTAFEVNAELQRQSILGKTQIARFYQQLSEWLAETFRRASSPDIAKTTTNKWLKLALEFQARCTRSGIPLDIVRNCQVTARRTVGQGSAYMRALSLTQLYTSLYPVLPEDGKVNLVDDLVAATAGREAVVRYNPAPELRTKEAQQVWEAQVENDTLHNRGQVTLTPYQNDVIHGQEHLAFSAQAANSLIQGADPAEVLGILQAAGAHTAMHLQRLAQNPTRKNEFQALKKQWTQLARIADDLEFQQKRKTEEMAKAKIMAAKAQAVAEGTDPEVQLRQAELQAKLQLAAQKQQGNQQLKAQKQAVDTGLKVQKQQADTAIKVRQTQADIALKDAETAAGIRQGAAKTASDIKLQQTKAKKEPALT